MRTLIIASLAALASGQTPDKNLTFDAATIKPAALPTMNGRGVVMGRGGRGGPGSNDPGRINYPMVTVKNLLTIAYDVKMFQITGPEWLDSERFEVQATMPPETTKEQFHIMLQNLLAERFKMKIHMETKDLPMYSMIIGKNGPKLKESAPQPEKKEDAPEDAPPPKFPAPGQMKFDADGFPTNLPVPPGGRGGLFQIMMPGRARMIATGQTMKDLAERLSTMLSRPVTDQTGLTGKYDFTLTFAPPEGTGPGGRGMEMAIARAPGGGEAGRGALSTNEDLPPPPDLMTAMQSQLGLKLDPKKGPVELIVVDHMEKTPTEN